MHHTANDVMQAVIHHSYGPPEALRMGELAKPAPGPEQVLIRVHAAGLNAADRYLLRGEPYAIRPVAGGLRRPRRGYVLGRDVAGTVEAAGARVTEPRPGDPVYAECPGALAEYVTAPAKVVAPMPANLTFAQAAAMPLAGATALQGLRDRGRVRPGQQVLITGASGGVGTFAVQVAAWLGAEVTAVCRAKHAELVRSLGATAVVDYTETDFTRTGQRYDVIFDLVGDRPVRSLRRVLTPAGTLVLSAGAGGRWLGPIRRLVAALAADPFTRQRLRPLAAVPRRGDLVTLAKLSEADQLRPVVDRVYPFDEAVDAVRHLDRRGFAGKLVVAMVEQE